VTRFTTRPEIRGTFGVVTSTHWLATAAGMSILEKGGNAFDAAVATGFALQVVEPHLNGPAGDVSILIAPADRDVQVVCGQGVAPMAATIDAYRNEGLELVPGTGLLATVVPGVFDSWMLLLRDHGTMKLSDVMQYAIGFAADGCPLIENACNAIDNVREMFETEWTSSADIFLPNGAVPKPGELFRNPVLAETYTRIVREAEAAGAGREVQIDAARKIWREGFIAETIDDFCRNNEVVDSSGERHRGLLTGADLAAWEATYEDPIHFDYHGHTVYKTGPWGQGPVFLQQLALLENFDLSSMNEHDPEFIHTVTEATKLAFADREAFYGDPDFVDVPIETLLSRPYNEARARLIGERASMELRPGDIPGFGGKVINRPVGMSESPVAAGGGEPTVARYDDPPADGQGVVKGDTCHFDIIDKWGNMIAATPSGGWLQSSPSIPGLGFCLNTRGQMFWLDENATAKLEPGKRPRTTLTPSLCKRDDGHCLVFGTPGGDQQDQWSLHFFLRHVHFGLNLQEAIEAPSFHTAHLPSSFYPREFDAGSLTVESRLPRAAIDELIRRGHNVNVDGEWAIGRVTAAATDGEMLRAAANPRYMQGYAAGR